MRYRTFGRTNWNVSELGYGMWGLAGWTGSDDAESFQALQTAVDLGCNFFDTALAYGEGKSERILGELVRNNPSRKLYLATKIPPMNRKWPSRRGFAIRDVFPAKYIQESLEISLRNLGTSSVDLLQFHVWEDDWAHEAEWVQVMESLKRQKLVQAIGLSLNRWEPWNGIRTIETGLIDAVQVIYNIFDQNPEDELFPICQKHNVAVIARVPFDEGSLTGTLTRESRWPEGDWRNSYFVKENLEKTVDRVETLRPLVPASMTLPEMALRFCFSNPCVSTVIPGMRKIENVQKNVSASDAGPLPESLLTQLKAHRWDRTPTEWSQ